jgi:hypothetical protein
MWHALRVKSLPCARRSVSVGEFDQWIRVVSLSVSIEHVSELRGPIDPEAV